MSFGSIIKSIGSGLAKLNPLSLVGDVIGAGASLLTSHNANKTSKQITNAQIKAQQEANAANIASQEKINAANVASQERINQNQIDFAQGINDIMRRDARNAISDKRNDLMRAGYSAADPSLQGFSAASLSQPSLTAPTQIAPFVEPEFTPEMANALINAKTSSIGNITSMAQTLSDIALKRAQSSKTRAETVGLNKNNAWLDLMNKETYSQMLQATQNLFLDGKIKQGQADEIANNLSAFDTQFNLMKEQLSSIRISNESLRDRLAADLTETLSRVSNIQSSTANLDSDLKLKAVNKQILELERDMNKIEKRFMELGISFHGSDMFNSLARLFASPASSELIPTVLSGVSEMFNSLVTEASEAVSDDGSLLNFLWKGAKLVGKEAKHIVTMPFKK